MKFISSKTAQDIDYNLLSQGYTIEQLMELSGLAVAQCVYNCMSNKNKILVCVGPGNNGGDALVAARHLAYFGKQPVVFYPKQTSVLLYQNLKMILLNLGIEFVDEINLELYDLVIDGFLGYSFKGPLREPLKSHIDLLKTARIPLLSIDVPSGWDIDKGPNPGDLNPDFVFSLTAPKQCLKGFKGRHFIGGTFVKSVYKNFGLVMPAFDGKQYIEYPLANK
jgi:NAD(P)H-hydrate epimerase